MAGAGTVIDIVNAMADAQNKQWRDSAELAQLDRQNLMGEFAVSSDLAKLDESYLQSQYGIQNNLYNILELQSSGKKRVLDAQGELSRVGLSNKLELLKLQSEYDRYLYEKQTFDRKLKEEQSYLDQWGENDIRQKTINRELDAFAQKNGFPDGYKSFESTTMPFDLYYETVMKAKLDPSVSAAAFNTMNTQVTVAYRNIVNDYFGSVDALYSVAKMTPEERATQLKTLGVSENTFRTVLTIANSDPAVAQIANPNVAVDANITPQAMSSEVTLPQSAIETPAPSQTQTAPQQEAVPATPVEAPQSSAAAPAPTSASSTGANTSKVGENPYKFVKQERPATVHYENGSVSFTNTGSSETYAVENNTPPAGGLYLNSEVRSGLSEYAGALASVDPSMLNFESVATENRGAAFEGALAYGDLAKTLVNQFGPDVFDTKLNDRAMGETLKRALVVRKEIDNVFKAFPNAILERKAFISKFKQESEKATGFFKTRRARYRAAIEDKSVYQTLLLLGIDNALLKRIQNDEADSTDYHAVRLLYDGLIAEDAPFSPKAGGFGKKMANYLLKSQGG